MTWIFLGLAVVSSLAGVGATAWLLRKDEDELAQSVVTEGNIVEGLDDPIQKQSQDRLGRAAYAAVIADVLSRVEPGGRVVFAVTGPWGVGKTSFLNLVEEKLALQPQGPPKVFRFNPWFFSGTEQLVTRFLTELAEYARVQLPTNEDPLAKKLEAYATGLAPMQWVPFFGPWASRLGQASSAISSLRRQQHRTPSLEDTRRSLEVSLKRLPRPIFVFVDDVDRLEASEVREVLRLVRLVAHLPNLVYVLAYDQQQVEDAIGPDRATGQAYLEKIVQQPFDLSAPPAEKVRELLLEGLTQKLDNVPTGPFSVDRWAEVFPEVVNPLITNVRDTKRYLAAVESTIRAVGSEVNLVDLLALEAVRLFMPSAFALIASSPAIFVGKRQSEADSDPRVEELIATEPKGDALRALCLWVLPGASGSAGRSGVDSADEKEWRRDRRVADPEILTFYLSRVPTSTLLVMRATRLAADALLARDREAFSQVLNGIDRVLVEDVIQGLEDYESQYNPGAASVGVPVLAGWLGSLPERERGFLDFGPDIRIMRVVLRLLRSVESDRDRLQIVEETIAEGVSLWAQFELVNSVAHREGLGSKLVDEGSAVRLEMDVARRIAEATPEELQSHALTLLLWAGKLGGDDIRARVASRLGEQELLEQVLAASLTETRSQTMGSRAVHKSERLQWDALVELFGSEEAVVSASRVLTAAKESSQVGRAQSLIERYAEGWRPDRFS